MFHRGKIFLNIFTCLCHRWSEMCLKHDKMFNFDLTGFMFVPFVCYIGLFLLTEGICTYMYVCVCVFVCVCIKARVNGIKSYCLHVCLCTFTVIYIPSDLTSGYTKLHLYLSQKTQLAHTKTITVSYCHSPCCLCMCYSRGAHTLSWLLASFLYFHKAKETFIHRAALWEVVTAEDRGTISTPAFSSL